MVWGKPDFVHPRWDFRAQRGGEWAEGMCGFLLRVPIAIRQIRLPGTTPQDSKP